MTVNDPKGHPTKELDAPSKETGWGFIFATIGTLFVAAGIPVLIGLFLLYGFSDPIEREPVMVMLVATLGCLFASVIFWIMTRGKVDGAGIALPAAFVTAVIASSFFATQKPQSARDALAGWFGEDFSNPTFLASTNSVQTNAGTGQTENSKADNSANSSNVGSSSGSTLTLTRTEGPDAPPPKPNGSHHYLYLGLIEGAPSGPPALGDTRKDNFGESEIVYVGEVFSRPVWDKCISFAGRFFTVRRYGPEWSKSGNGLWSDEEIDSIRSMSNSGITYATDFQTAVDGFQNNSVSILQPPEGFLNLEAARNAYPKGLCQQTPGYNTVTYPKPVSAL